MKLETSKRILSLDGLRGLAALQVVLLHYVSAFTPDFANAEVFASAPNNRKWITGTPVFLIYNGYLAVFLFFILSGYVLSRSYSRYDFSSLKLTSARLLRLGVPVAVSIAISWIIMSCFISDHVTAGRILNSDFFKNLFLEGPVAHKINEFFFGPLLWGYEGSSIWSRFKMTAKMLPVLNVNYSLNFPLWSLHLELVGSLLIILIAKSRHRLPRFFHWAFVAVLTKLFFHSPILLFIIGYAVASIEPYTRTRFFQKANAATCAGYFALLYGITVSVRQSVGFSLVPSGLDAIWFGNPKDFWGAVLIFVGTWAAVSDSQLNFLKRVLDSRFAQFLGLYSFPVYITHAAVLFGPTAFLFNQLAKIFPSSTCIVIVSCIGIGGSFAFAMLFERYVDQPAVKLSRRVR